MQGIQKMQNLTAGLTMSASGNVATSATTKTSSATNDFQNVMEKQKPLQTKNDSSDSKQNAEVIAQKNQTSGNNKVITKEQASENSVTNNDQLAGDNVAVTNKQAVAKVEDQIQKSVKDVMDITDDDIKNALDELGMTIMDLLNPLNLQQFVLAVQGNGDPTELLTNENLLQTLQNLQEVVDMIDIESLTGMTVEEFTTMLDENFSGKEDIQNFSDALANTEGVNENQPETSQEEVTVVTSEKTNVISDIVMKEENVSHVAENVVDASLKDKDVVKFSVSPMEGKSEDDITAGVSLQTEKSEDGMNSEAESGSAFLSEEMSTEDGDVFVEQETQAATNEFQDFAMTFNQHISENDSVDRVQTPVSVRQAFEIFSQVTEQIKASFHEDMTRMEMQLNPESLGKVTISVSDKNGVMTANFYVQTEEAKAALEYQMSSLRESLESKNLKVEAVEVSVSDFSFAEHDSSAEGDAKNFEQGHGKRMSFFEDSEDGESSEGSGNVQEARRVGSSGGNIDYTA